jgi:hypothetical protein
MLDVLEKLKPNLAALVENPGLKGTGANAVPQEVAASWYSCRKCGHKVAGGEQFCGQCGSPRSSDYEPPTMQSKVASLWQMQETKRKDTRSGDESGELTDSIEVQGPLLPQAGASQADHSVAPPLEDFNAMSSDDMPWDLPASYDGHEDNGTEVVALATMPNPVDASALPSPAGFLERTGLHQHAAAFARFWKTRRGDIYLAIAVIMIAGVIRWEIVSRRPVAAPPAKKATAAAHQPASREIKLSVFERMLIAVGLAEAPEPPPDKGNPSVQVWVDVQTALYYCPGADLYGKTPKGKYTTQRDAQLDRYEPAYRKNCP